MLPTIAPMAVLSSLDEPVVDVGPARVELEVTEDWVDEPVDGDSVEVTDSEDWDESDDNVDDERDGNADDVGGKAEEGVAVMVEGRLGVTFIEPEEVGDAGRESVVLGGGVGPP